MATPILLTHRHRITMVVRQEVVAWVVDSRARLVLRLSRQGRDTQNVFVGEVCSFAAARSTINLRLGGALSLNGVCVQPYDRACGLRRVVNGVRIGTQIAL